MIKNQSNQYTLLKITITAVLFYLAGQLAMPLVSPASYSGTIWPPAGIGLGAMLLWGKRILPGVFLGDIGLKLAIYDISVLEMAPDSLLVVILMAVNSMLRAWLGAYFVQRYANYPNPLIELKYILRFFLYSSLIATFISSVLNVAALYMLSLVTFEGILLAIVHWWLGDSMGSVIFTPLFLLIFARDDEFWLRRRVSVGLPLVVLFLIAFVSFQLIKKQEEHRLQDVFNTYATQFQKAFESRYSNYLEQLKYVKYFFEVDEQVSEEEFLQFTQPLFSQPDLQSMLWVTCTEKWQENCQFTVKYKQSGAESINTSQLVHLDDGLLTHFARAHTKTVILARNNESQQDTQIVIVVPVYSRQTLAGVIIADLALESMIKSINHSLASADVFIQVHDENQMGRLLFQSDGARKLNTLLPLNYRFFVSPKLLFLFFPSADFLQNNYSVMVWWASVVIMFIVSLLTIVFLTLSGYAEVIKKKVKERTEALRISHIKLKESESQFKELVQAQSAIVWRYNPATRLFSFVSDEAEKLLGYPQYRWLTEPGFWESCIDPRDRDWAVFYRQDKTQQHQEYDFEYRVVTAEGNSVWIRDIVRFKYKNAEISELLGFTIDVTEQKQTEQQLRLAATTFDGLDGIVITDAKAKILRVNHSFEQITGYTAEQVIGKKPKVLFAANNPATLYKEVWHTLIDTGRFEGEILNRRRNGEVFPAWQRITAVTDAQNEVTHYVSVFTDITAQKESELKIHTMAFYDSLTSLPNRRLLFDRLEKEVAIAKRHEKSGALMFLDLDHFKLLNDSLGHHIGDELLIQVAERIKSVIREEDSAIRLGGDEFVVLIHANADSLQQAADHGLLVAEKIQRVLNEKFILQNYQHHISPSIGITLFPEESQTINKILQEADTAMYRSKDLGRNRISYFHPTMQAIADAKLQLEKELRVAIEQAQFVLYYQPQIDATDNSISAEALVRWVHPEKGIISPADFIPVAEETSMILALGKWIISAVCFQIKEWQQQGLSVNNIAINVSSKQFRQHDFVKTVQQSIEEAGISAELLEIELTEGVVIGDIKDTVEKMEALKALGVSIAIDDFGTGYSSLAYLKQLPLDVLKIDQSFVRDIMSDQSDAIIVETIIDMSHHLGLHTIAEGVESAEQHGFLHDKGCKMFQGYYFSKPLIAEDFYKRFINQDD